MKAVLTKDNIKISGICNESQLEMVTECVEGSGCSYDSKNNGTVIIVNGTKEQIIKFIDLWNE